MSSTNSTTTAITAYGFSKVVNAALKDQNLPVLPPQMFYTYKNKGLIGVEGKSPLTTEGAQEWVASYISRKQAKLTAEAAKIEAELAGDETSEESESADSDELVDVQ